MLKYLALLTDDFTITLILGYSEVKSKCNLWQQSTNNNNIPESINQVGDNYFEFLVYPNSSSILGLASL